MNINDLTTKLRTARDAYYHGTPSMSDAAFDALENSLRKADPTHDYFSEVGAPASKTGWEKVKHPVDMGSLGKAQNVEEFQEWLRLRGLVGSDLIISEKLDGISILLTYDEDGNFQTAATRGDGKEGEDISRNVLLMNGVPSKIENESGGKVYVRGEIVCHKSIHPIEFPNDSNPRNTASGTAKRQNAGWQKARHLNVYAYRLDYTNKDMDKGVSLTELRELGFDVPNYAIVKGSEVEEYYQEYIDATRDGLDYDIDGLVIEVDSVLIASRLGSHNGTPKGSLALKFPHESATTTLLDVVWQTGGTGRITPVAIFETVNLAGANVSKASLHNLKRLESLKLYKGCEILVSRRNDVIPMVEGNISKGLFVQ